MTLEILLDYLDGHGLILTDGELIEKALEEIGFTLNTEILAGGNKTINKKLSPRQLAVGKCPKCHHYPTWFNDVPLKAFCWGTDPKPHSEMSRRVPGKSQPYGRRTNTSWKQTKVVISA